MIISIEIPVIKGGWLTECIESVLAQTSQNWRLSLLWDGGDDLSKDILEKLQKKNHPQISVYFQENRGIAHSRRFLTEHSLGDFFLPVDDDDILTPDAVEKFLDAAHRMPWAGIIRSRRGFIDEQGNVIDMEDWFPFEPRHYVFGMTSDLFNHCHAYIIKRSVYERTSGWEGFPEYLFAGADCDIFAKIEEHAEIELIDECLYYYRINPERTSNKIGDSAADDMWRRIADKSIKRRGLPLKRVNEKQPFEFIRVDTQVPTKDMVDVVVPFWEANEEEIFYEFSRPSQFLDGTFYPVSGGRKYHQNLDTPLEPFNRIELVCSSNNPISGEIVVSFHSDKKSASLVAKANRKIHNSHMISDFVSMEIDKAGQNATSFRRLEVEFHPDRGNNDVLILHIWKKKKRNFLRRRIPYLWMRMFKHSPNYSRKRLELCLQSLKNAGIPDDAVFVIEKKQSAAANRNDGIRLSSRPLICFLDDDTEIVSPNLFDVLLEKLNSLKVDMIGPKIITDKGMIFCADPFFNEQLMPNPNGLGEYDHGQYDYTSFVPWLPSTFLITKREVCQSVGGFDENYIGCQHEDVDFCLKARSRGFQCCYAGEVTVKHFNCSRNNFHSANFDYFRRRWEIHRHLFDSSNIKRVINKL
jgi:GT2 family glycosyltransferase